MRGARGEPGEPRLGVDSVRFPLGDEARCSLSRLSRAERALLLPLRDSGPPHGMTPTPHEPLCPGGGGGGGGSDGEEEAALSAAPPQDPASDGLPSVAGLPSSSESVDSLEVSRSLLVVVAAVEELEAVRWSLPALTPLVPFLLPRRTSVAGELVPPPSERRFLDEADL